MECHFAFHRGSILEPHIKCAIASYNDTLEKLKVFGQLNALEKCFKICYVYVDIDPGIHKGKVKVALNEKQKKLRGFSYGKNIANFERFR